MTRVIDEFWTELLSTSAVLDECDYYELLGVPRDADPTRVSDAYFQRVRALHPDLFGAERDQHRIQALTRVAARLGEARRVLQDPRHRAAYDEALGRGRTRLPHIDDRPRLTDTRDPKSPSARALCEEAALLSSEGLTDQARARLELAHSFEPSSRAIARALADLEPAAAPAEPPAPLSPAEPGAGLQPRLHVRCRTWDQAAKLHEMITAGSRAFVRTTIAATVDSQVDVQVILPSGSTVLVPATVVQVDADSGVRIEFPLGSHERADLRRMLARPTFLEAETVEMDMSNLIDEATRPDLLAIGADDVGTAGERDP